MTQYNVTGMSCAACSARVEKAVKKVPGVESCAVSLLTNSMGVEGSADPAAVIAAVTEAGYGASPKQSGESAANAAPSQAADALADHETPRLRRRLLWSLGFLLVLMYFSMGHMMWHWPLPKWFEGNHIAMGLVQLLLAAVVMVINQRFFISGFKALWHRSPNMDTLVALGSAASFVWSVYALFAMTRAQVDGDMAAVETFMMEFYFESAAMILTLITVGKMLEARSKGKTTDALNGLMKLAPQTAVLIREGREVTVPISQVLRDDIFVVRPGESVPVDGVILEGSSAVNEAALTGESIPVDKTVGDSLSAATVNQSGFLKARATRVGEDTTLSQIIKMVSDAAATKAPIAKVADKVSGIFVPTVISIAVITTVVWLLLGREFSYALARGISVLVISCPCALGLATPVAIMVGNGVGARNGILFKTAVSLEETGKAKTVVLDKTGTITTGEPRVTDVLPAPGVTEEELLTVALALEQKSEHPLARAIMALADPAGSQGTGNREQGTGNGEQGTENGEQGTGTNQSLPLEGTGGVPWQKVPPQGADEVASRRQTCTVQTTNAQIGSTSPARTGSQGTGNGEQGTGNGEQAILNSQFSTLNSQSLPAVTDFRALPGNGLEARLAGEVLLGGSVKFISEQLTARAADSSQFSVLNSQLRTAADSLAAAGKTPLLFARGGRLLGLIAVADVIKPESPQAVKDLQNIGIKVVMLTGDNQRTAEAIGRQAGVDQVIAGVLPEGKEAEIRKLQQTGKVIMVGDGINDAPALTRADIGIAIGAGTDVAIDAADVVLMKSRLSDVPAALRLSRATLRNIHQNLFWAFFYNAIGIPLAAGVFIKAFGWTLNPMFGAAAMSLSSFCVVTNALRLNWVRIGVEANGNRHQGSGNPHQAIGNRHQASGPLVGRPDSGRRVPARTAFQGTGNGEQAVGDGFPVPGTGNREQGTNQLVGGGVLDASAAGTCQSLPIEGTGGVPEQKVPPQGADEVASEESEGLVLTVKGMMCNNCERHVREALEALPGVESARPDFHTGLVTVRGNADDKALKTAIQSAGYKLKKVQRK